MSDTLRHTDEWVVEKELGGYRLPDHAIDLSAWLRDGLEVYNLFVSMKPLFFAMLEAHGGEFRLSGKKANEDVGRFRVSIHEEDVGTSAGPDYDRLIVATLTEPTGTTERFVDVPPLATPPRPRGDRP